MPDFNRWEWRDADEFYADLMHGPRPRGPRRSARPVKASPAEAGWHEAEWTEDAIEWTVAEAGDVVEASVIEDASGPTVEMLSPFPATLDGGGVVEAGRVFDDLVHRARHVGEVVTEADEDAEWEAVALPRSSTPPKDLPPGAVVIKRALGEGRLASVLILGQTVDVPGLYAADGRIRPDILILVRRSRSAARPATVVLSAEDSETSLVMEAGAVEADTAVVDTEPEVLEGEQADEAVPQNGRGAFRHAPLGGDPGDNVEVRWNLDSTTTANSTVDVVVHLHGFGKNTGDFLARKAGAAGVDLLDASGALKVRAKKPTVVIIPRGQFTAPRSWHFTALPDKAAFDALCDAALAWVATSVLKLPAGSTLKPGRVTLMAHSGGGAGLSTLLDKGVNPDEVVCFDSMYGGEDAIKKWADARIQSKQPSQYGLRVFYTGCSGPRKDAPGGRWVPQNTGDPVYEEPGSWSFWPSDKKWHLGSTEVSARRLQYALDRMLTTIKDGAALAPRYRVERTAVAHSDIPSRYSPLLLDDIAAKMPDASAAPAATSRPACVNNDDWLTKAPIKPGGTDPPPLKPMNPEKPADK